MLFDTQAFEQYILFVGTYSVADELCDLLRTGFAEEHAFARYFVGRSRYSGLHGDKERSCAVQSSFGEPIESELLKVDELLGITFAETANHIGVDTLTVHLGTVSSEVTDTCRCEPDELDAFLFGERDDREQLVKIDIRLEFALNFHFHGKLAEQDDVTLLCGLEQRSRIVREQRSRGLHIHSHRSVKQRLEQCSITDSTGSVVTDHHRVIAQNKHMQRLLLCHNKHTHHEQRKEKKLFGFHIDCSIKFTLLCPCTRTSFLHTHATDCASAHK